MTLYGITGPAGSGKTTAASLMARDHRLHIAGFADPIRRAAIELVPHWDAWHLGGGKEVRCAHTGLTPRHVLRVLGDHGRAMDPEIYCRHLLARVDGGEFGTPPRVVLHDVRTRAEAETVRAYGTLFHMRRPGVGWSGDHGTEVGFELAPEDVVLMNHGDIAQLRREIRGALCALRDGGVRLQGGESVA